MNSIVSSPSPIAPIAHGRLCVASESEQPASSISPRLAVIPASSSASRPNVWLSRRCGAARSTSRA
jgi:hypothetical protein